MMTAYTDGATSKNGQAGAKGGWAIAIIDEENYVEYTNSGHIENATNNICELTAIINACEFLRLHGAGGIIYSDSAYCINCYKQKWYKNWINNGWRNSKKQPVANQDLWKQLIPFFENENYKFEKVSGHSGVIWNELVDKMAVEARQW